MATDPNAGRPVAPSTFALLMATGALLVLLGAAHGGWLPLPLWLRTYALTALVTQCAAVVALWQVVRSSGRGTASSRAWLILFCGMYLFMVGHACLSAQRFSNEAGTAGFPTAADIFFIAGQVLMLTGLVVHLVAYARTGLPLGTRASYVIMYTVVAVVVAFLTWKLNIPMWSDSTLTFGWKAVSTAYHAIDMLTLCIALALMRIAFILRGGSLAHGWAGIATAFLATMVGDMMFGIEIDSRYSALVFLASYIALMFGAMRHREVVLSVG